MKRCTSGLPPAAAGRAKTTCLHSLSLWGDRSGWCAKRFSGLSCLQCESAAGGKGVEPAPWQSCAAGPVRRAKPWGEAEVALGWRSFLGAPGRVGLELERHQVFSTPLERCQTERTYRKAKDWSSGFLLIFNSSKGCSWCFHCRCESGRTLQLTAELADFVFPDLWQRNQVDQTSSVKKRSL